MIQRINIQFTAWTTGNYNSKWAHSVLSIILPLSGDWWLKMVAHLCAFIWSESPRFRPLRSGIYCGWCRCHRQQYSATTNVIRIGNIRIVESRKKDREKAKNTQWMATMRVKTSRSDRWKKLWCERMEWAEPLFVSKSGWTKMNSILDDVCK